MRNIPVLTSIASVATGTSVWFLDIWGVVHNGVRPYPSTGEACREFRNAGGTVILVSNAPRPRDSVVAQLNRIGVDRDAYDAVVTSGDVARSLIDACGDGRILHIGPERDKGVFEKLATMPNATANDADVAVCTGLYDDEAETPDDYREMLAALLARRVPMICANPDIKVERDGRIIYCAGAIAAAYDALGGDVRYAGKPYLPIYDIARAKAAELRNATVGKDKVLAIGDGISTDIEGAHRFGIRSLYIASGVHVAPDETIAHAAARLFSDPAKPAPIAVMQQLAW